MDLDSTRGIQPELQRQQQEKGGAFATMAMKEFEMADVSAGAWGCHQDDHKSLRAAQSISLGTQRCLPGGNTHTLSKGLKARSLPVTVARMHHDSFRPQHPPLQ